MNSASFFKQTGVYFNKTCRIALKEKAWKYILFSVIISFVVAPIIGDNIYDNYENTRFSLFCIVSVCIWIGLFNSIQSICKEHAIIRSEYRSGMKISSYVTANALWQFIICLVQSAIIIAVFSIFIDLNRGGVMLIPIVENFISVFLLIAGSDVLGLMISAIASNAAAAMTAMPFVLIIQLIFSGVLFNLEGFTETISNITFSKWGMSAFGSVIDLNSNEKYPLLYSQFVPGGLLRVDEDPCFNNTPDALAGAWLWCIGITMVSFIICIVCLKIRNSKS